MSKVIELAGTNAAIDLVREGEVSSHPRNSVWGHLDCVPRMTRMAERYRNDCASATDHEVISVVRSIAPVAENVKRNSSVALA